VGGAVRGQHPVGLDPLVKGVLVPFHSGWLLLKSSGGPFWRRARHKQSMPPDDKGSEEIPWFRRFGPDGKPEPAVARGDNGEISIIDADGWAASFKNGKWYSGILWQHLQLAEFSPERDEVYRLYNKARAAVEPEKGKQS